MNNNQPFQILTLDGGGIKGLFSAAVLAAIEEDLQVNIIDHFDLIAGTSTGGIIALGLGLGFRPRELVQFYLNEGPKIFSKGIGTNWIRQWFFSNYSSRPLENALKNCFKDRLFGDSTKRLVIPSYNLGEDDVYIFRTPHASRLKRDYKVPAWKVALATSSAPTFFPCTREVDSARLIDGGVWANNPTMVAIVEAVGTLGIPINSISLLNIGTSVAISQRRKRLNNGGIIAWGLESAAIDIIMRGQSISANNQAMFLLGSENYERLNPTVSANEFSLDNVSKVDDLIGKAGHYSRAFCPTFEKKFRPHMATEFNPLFP